MTEIAKSQGRAAARRADHGRLVMIWLLAALFGLFAPRILPGLTLVEHWAGDVRRVLMAQPRPQHADIVLLTITEQTLAQLAYRSPVDRGFLARLLDHLESVGVRAVGFDILFDGPTEPEKDQALAAAIARFPGPVVLSWADQGDGLTPAQAKYLRDFTAGHLTGPVNLVKDDVDGVVRHIYGGRRDGDGFRRGFAATLAQALGAAPPQGDIALAYRPGPDAATPAFRAFPAHTAAFLPADWLAGKIVLIGAELPLDDRHRTPFAAVVGGAEGSLSGLAIHAHGLAQILEGGAPPGQPAIISALLAAGVAAVGVGLALLSAGLLVKILTALGALAALWGGGFWLFGETQMLLPLFSPSLGLGVGFGLAQAVLWRRADQDRTFIGQAFGQYVSPAVVAALQEDPSSLSLTGERRELSVIFTDIAGFTALTERTPPGILVPLLNEYMAGMGEVILGHEGTIDKYIGDAVMVFFNAPVAQPDHAARAVACALAMDDFAQEFVARTRLRGLKMGHTRIGVHCGAATVGNFGGAARFDYTAVGDVVNTTARLESINKMLGTRVCLSADVVARSGHTRVRPVGELELYGKTEPVTAYTPVAAEQPAEQTELYLQAYAKLEGGDAAGALSLFVRLAGQYPDDTLAQMHLARLGNGESGIRIRMEGK